ncbi:MAG: hypothetical protein INQ03_15160 [Candidatus Heimdallarchaeota archaeon]|nr:hypothetical protein [Candidatus Heimdallarchaeota archaeon]
MRVLIAGAGSIGTVVGMLVQKDHEVNLLRRSGTFGLISHTITGVKNFESKIQILDSNVELLDQIYDIIILSTQRQQSEQILKYLERQNIPENTIFLCLQNGMHVSDPVQKYFPNNPIVQGVVWWSATLIDSSTVYYHREAPTFLGSVKGDGLNVAKSLLAPHFDIQISDDIFSEVRKKLLLNIVSPVLALIKQPYPQGLNNLRIRTITRIVFDDVLSIALERGWEIDDKLVGFHKLLHSDTLSEQSPQSNHVHKVSTQISAEKHGGRGSNAGELLGYFILQGSKSCEILLSTVMKLEPHYYALMDDEIDDLLTELNSLNISCPLP